MATGVQNISLTDYDSQMAEFARRQRMAQALQEQAAAPIEVQSYKGIQAPISSLSILSKALKSYAGARGERKAVEEKGALDKLARELAAARGSSYMPAEEPAPNPTAITPQALAAALGGQPVMDTQSGASRAAGIASNPLAVAAPPPAAPPPGMVPNTQSGASIAMGMGPNPNAAPTPMPPAAPSPAPAGAMAPINVPTPRPAGPSVAQLQAGLSKALSDADSDPNPYVRQNAARMIPVIQQSISRAQQQADTVDTRNYNKGVVTEERAYQSSNAETLREADVTRATEQAEALIAGGDFSDAQASVIRQAAAAGSEALNAVRSTVMTKAFADKNSILTPEEVRAAGFPVGSVVSVNDTTKEIKLEYNPRPDETAALNARTSQYNAQTARRAAEAAKVAATGTEGQRRSAGFAYRTIEANSRLNALADRGIMMPSRGSVVTDRNGQIIRMAATTENDRLFFQAAKEWLAPVLRKDTGAAVTDEELETYMDIYIPRPGDQQRVLDNKAAARQVAMTALVNESGQAFSSAYPDSGGFQTQSRPKRSAEPGALVGSSTVKGVTDR